MCNRSDYEAEQAKLSQQLQSIMDCMTVRLETTHSHRGPLQHKSNTLISNNYNVKKRSQNISDALVQPTQEKGFYK